MKIPTSVAIACLIFNILFIGWILLEGIPYYLQLIGELSK